MNLRAQHEPLREEFLAAIQEVLLNSAFSSGPFVNKFETDFAKYCGTQHAIGVGSGTEALWLTLLALGIGRGDEVITVPNTFVATVEAISFCGAKPVLVDIEAGSYNLDPSLLEAAITPRTKAIIPVHLFGQPADMDPILSIAHKHGLQVIEDAAQAHGAVYRGKMAGALGGAGCFSFYPGKNLGALGEAGAVITNNRALHDKIVALRDHGQTEKFCHEFIGWNARMDGIQGAVLSVKLKHLPAANRSRKSHAALYSELLKAIPGIGLPQTMDDREHVYHVYAIRVKERDKVRRALQSKGIQCGIHYPVPIHLQEAYQFLGYASGSFPVAEQCAKEFLSLPMFPELTVEQVHLVCQELKACLVQGVAHECFA